MVISIQGRRRQCLAWSFACQVFFLPAAHSDMPVEIPVLPGDAKNLAGWEQKPFSGETTYTLVAENDHSVLRARSSGTASGLYRKLEIELEKYPYLNWRWKIGRRLAGLDETSRAGDDYVARVYVIAKDGLLFWKTRAICYVWASGMEKGAVWNNAYAGQSVKMVAVRSGEDALSRWHLEKRNVLRDFAELFGDEITEVDSVAVMVDTDNSQQQATSYFSDISFSAR